MSIVKISTTGLAEARMDSIVKLFTTDRGRKNLHTVGGRALQSYLKGYHRIYGRAGKWENRSLPTHGRGRKKTRFASRVVKAWSAPVSTPNSVEVSNDTPGFNLKVDGGVVRSLNKYGLTIPMTPDAHGKKVKTYRQDYPKRRLVRPRGRNYLAWMQKSGKVVVVYLLRPQMTYKPWKGALPSDDMMLDRVWDDGFGPLIGELERKAAKKKPT